MYSQIGILIVRGLAIYVFTIAFKQLFRVIGTIAHYDFPFFEYNLPILLTAAGFGLLSIILWKFAPLLSKKMVVTNDEAKSPLSYEEVLNITVIAFGLLILSGAISPAVDSVYTIINADEYQPLSLYDWKKITATALSLSLALIFIFTPKGLVRLIQIARNAGCDVKENS